MLRLVILAASLWIIPTSYGQFPLGGLATTDDGATLYFVRETKFIPGSSGGLIPSKIFIADANGVRVYADKIAGFPEGYVLSMETPSVSGDGTVVAYSGSYQSAVVDSLFSWHYAQFYKTLVGITDGPALEVDFGGPHLSSNGRYLVFTEQSPRFLDLSTGRQMIIPVSYGASSGNSIVSTDGTVLLSDGSALYLWREDLGVREFSVHNSDAILDDAATKAILTSGNELLLLDLSTGSTRILANGRSPSMSRDGNRIAFLSTVDGIPQAFVADATGDGLRQITSDPSGVATLTLSGNGSVLYSRTGADSILRIDLGRPERANRGLQDRRPHHSTIVVVRDLWQLP